MLLEMFHLGDWTAYVELANVFIVYFALGVPFGILASYLHSGRRDSIDLVRVIYHLAFWPFIAFFRAFRTNQTGSLDSAENRDGTAPAKDAASLRRRIRSKRAALDGLNAAHRSAVAAADLELPFRDCIGTPNPSLAAKCFQRRNIAKLERHIAQAEADLSQSLAEMDRAASAYPLLRGSAGAERTTSDLC